MYLNVCQNIKIHDIIIGLKVMKIFYFMIFEYRLGKQNFNVEFINCVYFDWLILKL